MLAATEPIRLGPLPPTAAAALPAGRHAAAAEIGAELSPDWPQRDLLDLLTRQAEIAGEEAVWGIWLIIDRETNIVVGDIGFHGPPTARGSGRDRLLRGSQPPPSRLCDRGRNSTDRVGETSTASPHHRRRMLARRGVGARPGPRGLQPDRKAGRRAAVAALARRLSIGLGRADSGCAFAPFALA